MMNRRMGRQAQVYSHHQQEEEALKMKSGYVVMKSLGLVVAACLMILPVFFVLAIILREQPFDQILSEARPIDANPRKGSEAASIKSGNAHQDKLLDGLLSAEFSEKSCLSRYQSVLYRRPSPYKPSSYLQSRLRKYEDLHKRCAPYTEPYYKTLEKLKSGQHIGETDCNYVVWMSYSGLGNRILTLTSAFLYALLTNRVLLIDRGKDIDDLFCEPFPKTTWLLPLDFPLNPFENLGQKSPGTYGNMLKRNAINNTMDSPLPFLYLHLAHDYGDHDKLFFCDQEQSLLQKIPWLIMRTDNYFVPSLFLMSTFQQELTALFPSRDMVFHLLGRYLFHPTNVVWGLITRYYETYLANADERVGIQIRVFDIGTPPFQHVLDQIISCFLKEKLLPEVNTQEAILTPSEKQKSKAVLITSLSAGYFDKIRTMYWENPTVTGEVIQVYQPSNEEVQQTETKMHDRKAWAEMYLLSLTDVLITSSWSTFGYVAQGLGGLKPWMLYKSENRTTPDPPCRRVMSLEPCFHSAPSMNCKTKTWMDEGKLVPHVRHCEDVSWGLKLVEHDVL